MYASRTRRGERAAATMLNSIRIRLTLWFTGILALVLVGFAVTAYVFLSYTVALQTDRTLKELSRSFVDMIDSEYNDKDGQISPDEATIDAIREALDDLRYRNYQIYAFDPQNKLISPDGPDSNSQVNDLIHKFTSAGQDSAFYDLQTGQSLTRLFAARFAKGGQTYEVVVSHPLTEEAEFNRRFLLTLAISIPAALLLSCFGGYFLARKALSPVVAMTASASKISATNLNERLPLQNEKDELGRLATVFNSLLARLEASFENQRRFMADASHELRTPLAIVRGESEIAISKDDRSIDDYRGSLEIVNDESKRLTKIVENLFTLARADAGQLQTNFAPVYLDEIAGEAVRSMRVLADQKAIGLTFSSSAEMRFYGDASLLHRLFLNLLDNAVKYSDRGTAVSVVCRSADGRFLIEISDTGPGIPEAEREKIFERFYRLDRARSRAGQSSTGGAGLGLSISLWIASVHGGKISVIGPQTGGSVFIVEFAGDRSKND